MVLIDEIELIALLCALLAWYFLNGSSARKSDKKRGRVCIVRFTVCVISESEMWECQIKQFSFMCECQIGAYLITLTN